MIQNCYFITGTDTGVGKTFVSAALLARAGQQGYTTAAFKPVAAGAENTPDGWRNDDALTLLGAINQPMSYGMVNPVCLKAATAPHLAAAEEGIELSVNGLVEKYSSLNNLEADFTLVEGAGGWRVPLNARETLADFARQLGCPVILVVAMRLGCINHALLTAEAIVADGLEIAGWVANSPEREPMVRYSQTVAALKSRLPSPLLGEIPFQPEGDFTLAAAHLRLPQGLERRNDYG